MHDICPYPAPTKESFESGHKWEAYLYFVWEREAIRIARDNGYEKPWTIDPIFEKYKFCNIRRKDDRVTHWLLKHVYNDVLPDDDVWFTAAICRLINWPPTLLELKRWDVLPQVAEEFNTPKFIAIIQELIHDKPKVYGGAYMVYPGRETGSKKSEFIATKVLEPLIRLAPWVRKAIKENRVESLVDVISSSFGMSSFMAGQVAADLTYIPGQLDKAEDLYDFAPIGPGSQEGLNYIFGNKKGTQWKQGEFNRALIRAHEKIKSECGIMDLTLHDVQNTFCEASKYFRTMLGDGKPRSLYKPETEF